MKKIITPFFLLTILLLISVQTHAQEWDYETYPRADIELTHLDAELKIESDGQLEGDLIFSVTFKNSFADSLFLDTAGIDIQAVTMNEEETDFLIEDSQLIIVPEVTFTKNDEAEIGIKYKASPAFGTHISSSGTVWTSFLPRTTQHWLPIIDSPRVQLLTDFTITHPAGTTVVANGRKGLSEVVDTEYERTTYSTENPVSSSSLGWALFNEVQTASTVTSEEIRNSYSIFSRRSNPQIYVYSETDENPEEALLAGAEMYNQIVEELGMEFPYGDLQIIILEDDFMEIKQFGDGMLFIYENKGDIKKQIDHGILSMFAESVIEAPSWSDSDAARIAEALLLNSFEIDLRGSENQSLEPYNTYSVQNSKLWQQFLATEAPAAFLEGVEIMYEKTPENRPLILGWNEFSDMLYDETGRSWIEGVELPKPVSETETGDTTYTYKAIIDWEEGSTSAEIRFEADSIAVDELVTVDAEVIGFSETQERELSFTGSSDGVVLNVPATLENIKLTVRDRSDVVLNTEKPFLFWMYQLRNDEKQDRRAEAANGISAYSENPDIELLLNDVLQAEESDIVIANVLRAMSEITDGDSGTDERFLRYAGPNYDMNIRIAAVEALANYEGNERVLSRLQSLVRRESDKTLQKAALHSIAGVTDEERLADITESFISQEVLPTQQPLMLEILSKNGAEEQSVELADQAINQNLPYRTVEEIVGFLITVDQSPGNWENRLPELLENPHPGVRILAAKAIDKLPANDREPLIEYALSNEFDERVRRILRGE